MIYVALGLFILAVVLLLTEGWSTGFGFFGVPGLIALAVSIFITIVFVPFGLFIVVGVLVFSIPIDIAIIKYLRKRQLYGKLILTEVLEDDKNDTAGLEYFIGKEGITKTALRPYGQADFNGTKVEVCSDSNYIPQNKKVQVINVKESRVFVRLSEGN